MNNYGISNDAVCCPEPTRTLVDLLKEQEVILQDVLCNVKCIHDCVVGIPLVGEPIVAPKQKTIVTDTAETNAKLIAIAKAVHEIGCTIGCD